MNFPCPTKIDCPGTDFPVTNYSAEGAEATLPYIGVVWPPPVNPPAGSGFWATGCIGECLSYTSQQEADECAQLQAALCDIGPNDGGGGGGGGTPYYSGEASCTVYCTDGTAFTYYVNAGLFVAWTQAEANAIAQAYACEKANESKVCLGDLQRCWCLGDARTSTIVPSGGVVAAWVVVSGSLPPGLVFNGGAVSGIPTTGGTYTVTIRGYLANGSYAQRTYVLIALNITQTTLPNGTEGANYDQQLTVTGGTAPYTFTLIGGGFPLGVDITSAGLITGVVGEVGVFAPVIQVTDVTGCICSRAFELVTVPFAPTYRILYWTMEESLLADRVDSVESLHAPAVAQSVSWADHTATAIGIDSGSGLFGNGCRMAKGLQNTWINGGFIGPFTTIGRVQVSNSTSLRQDGTGLSFCFWLKVNVLNTVPVFIEYIKNGSFKTTLEFTNTYCRCVVNDTGLVHSENISLPIPTLGAWTFYELYHDPVTGKMGAVINNSTDYPSSFTPVIAASVNGTFTVVMNSTSGAFNSTFDATDAQDFIVDEVLIRMDSRLTVAQRAYLYNAGAGRTWPIVLP